MSGSSWWIPKLEELSIDQLNQLISELGPIAVLTRERDAKLLMLAVNGLSRALALALVKPHPEWSYVDATTKAQLYSVPSELVFDLREVFRRNAMTGREIDELEGHCSSEGLRLLQKARDAYMKDASTKAHRMAAEEALRSSYDDWAAGSTSDQDVEDRFNAKVDGMDERLRLRAWLRDEFGITCKRSFKRYLQAIQIIAKKHPTEFQRLDYQAHTQIMNKAEKLYRKAVANNCTPKVIEDWEQLVASGAMRAQPLGIFRRPNGTEVWGDGLPVIYDKDNQPRRPMQGLFGKTVTQ